jgi:hypothetical protein
MKLIINTKAISSIVLLLAFFLTSNCSDDFLNRVPKSRYTEDNYYVSNDAVSAACTPLYNRAWFGFHQRAMFGIGSLRANDAYNPYAFAEFVRFQTTALTNEVSQAWASLYTVVTMVNATIDGVENKCMPEVTQAAKDRALGECYLMRAAAYFYMVRIWGPVILFEDNVDMIHAPIRPLNPEEDVFKFIIRDLRRACDLLPEKDSNGRATAYSAKAMLAKVLLAHSGWNKATRDETELAECIRLCEDVIDHSGSRLIEYENLFKYKYNLNEESLLAMRWVALGQWGTQNTLLSDLSFSEVCDVGCWGNNLVASIDMINLYNLDTKNHDSIRRKATFFIPGEHYDYIKSAHGGYTYDIDWMQVKKGVVGSKEDNDGLIDQMNSPLHTYIIRLADVYLMHAEACLGNNTELNGGRGLTSFNTIRERANVSLKDKITFQDIVNERRIEFCMEYQNWFEMVTWYRWKPAEMLAYFQNQLRSYLINKDGIKVNLDGTISWHVAFFNKDGEDVWDSVEGYTDENNFTPTVITDNNIFIPYPESDRLQNPYLSQDPVPYNFNE